MIEGFGRLTAITPISFWFLRHGQTDWNRDNLAQGSVDIPLNQTGIDQARTAAAALDGQGIASMVCSPLIRAQVTADIIAAKLGIVATADPALREAAFGEMEGKPMLAQWFTDWIEERHTPAGAEPFSAVRARATETVNRILASRAGPVLIIAHGAFFRGLRAAMGLAPQDRLMNAVPLYCSPGEPWTLRSASGDSHGA